MTIQSASLSDRGRRANNEDFAAFFEPEEFEELKERGCLYIIADGVGGAAQGERASQFAAQKVLFEYYQPSSLQPPEHLQDIMERVNGDIYAYAMDNHTRMATTMVAAIVRQGILHVANVGDSRAYLIRGGNVTQINRDHSIVGEMMAHGEMTEAEAMASKIKNRLTRSIGGEPEVTVDLYPPIPLKNGDKILLCTDGLTRYALREDIARMTAQGTNEEVAQRLVQFANESGGADNTSVVFASYQSIGESAPTIHIARPQPVDLDVLVTQPGELMQSVPKNRKVTLTFTSFALFAGGAMATLLIGSMMLRIATSVFFPAITPSITITPMQVTPTLYFIPAETPTPSFTSTATIPTMIPALPLKPKPEVQNNCPTIIIIRIEPGMSSAQYKENEVLAFLEIGKNAIAVGKKLSDTTPHNNTGWWIQIIYPPGTETKNWISKEDCVAIDQAVFETLPTIP